MGIVVVAQSKISGQLEASYGDSLSGETSRFTLVTDAGRIILDVSGLRAENQNRIAFFEGKSVISEGQKMIDPQTKRKVWHANSIELLSEPNSQLFTTQHTNQSYKPTGVQNWLVVLCRFSDQPNLSPHDTNYYQTMFGSNYPGLDNYWREASYNVMSIRLGAVQGWYNLPYPRSHYVVNNDANLDALYQDCTGRANQDVNVANYNGVSMFFNQALDGFAWGARRLDTWNGITKNMAVSWIPDITGYSYQSNVGHEMGHGFGLPHSSGPYNRVYDSGWDIMSHGFNCGIFVGMYNCIAPHPIAYDKDKLGWIPQNKDLVWTSDLLPTTFNLDALSGLNQSNTGYLLAEIPLDSVDINKATQFYTIEARTKQGYDVNIPLEGVVIHEVNTNRSEPAHVEDTDNNNDPNDAGAVLTPGEQFIDSDRSIVIQVNSSTDTGYSLTLTSQKPTVSISSPVGSVTYSDQTDITFNAQAYTSLGTVAKIDFLFGDQIIGTSYNSPYDFTWPHVPVGYYPIQARVTDNHGQTNLSNMVYVSVVMPFTSWQSNYGGGSNMPSSLIQFNNVLWQTRTGYDQKIYMRSSQNGLNWTNWEATDGHTQDVVTMAVYQNKLWQIARGTGNRIFGRSSTNGTQWSNWLEIGGNTSNSIGLATFNSQLCIVARGSSDKIYTRCSSDGIQWGVWYENGGTTKLAPRIATFNNVLYEVVRGDDRKIYERTSNDGKSWTEWTSSNSATDQSVDITQVGSILYESAVGNGGGIYTRYLKSGIGWSNWSENGGQSQIFPVQSEFKSMLWQSVRGNDGEIYTRHLA